VGGNRQIPLSEVCESLSQICCSIFELTQRVICPHVINPHPCVGGVYSSYCVYMCWPALLSAAVPLPGLGSLCTNINYWR